MATLELLQICEVTLRCKVLSLWELKFSPTATVVCHLIAVVTRAELVELPLTVLVTQCLRIAQSLNGLDVQLHCNLRLEPLVQSLIVGQHTVGYDIIVQCLASPHIIACRAFRVKWRTSRVIIQRLLEVCLLILIRSIGSTSSLTIIHDRTDL